MGKCKYCGQDCGWFSSYHDACKQKYEQGVRELTDILNLCFANKTDFYLKEGEVNTILLNSYIKEQFKEELFVNVLDNAIDSYLNDNIIDDQEKKMVARYIQFSGLPTNVLNKNHAIEKMLQSEVLLDILNGKKPNPKITIGGDFPFMLNKNENIVWLFRNITLHQQKVQREYVGRSRGISVRVMKGVYYRTGGFKGHPIETTIMQKIGTGSVCFTDKHIYYHSPEKSLKIPYSKILSVDSYSNGIGLQKDGANDKPIFLEGLNSWFAYNVIANFKN